MPKRKTPEPTIKVHERFDREEWGWRANGIDQHFKMRAVGHYTIAGDQGCWRLIRREIWTNGVCEIGYVVNRVYPSGDWDDDVGGVWRRRPAFARVRAVIEKSLTGPAGSPVSAAAVNKWSNLSPSKKKAAIRAMLAKRGKRS